MCSSDKALYYRFLNYRTVLLRLQVDRLYIIKDDIKLKDIENKVF